MDLNKRNEIVLKQEKRREKLLEQIGELCTLGQLEVIVRHVVNTKREVGSYTIPIK